jgi:hypothetical protein
MAISPDEKTILIQREAASSDLMLIDTGPLRVIT